MRPYELASSGGCWHEALWRAKELHRNFPGRRELKFDRIASPNNGVIELADEKRNIRVFHGYDRGEGKQTTAAAKRSYEAKPRVDIDYDTLSDEVSRRFPQILKCLAE